jgi:hypothetical protein
MMRKPVVIVGLILVPLVTTSAVVAHLTKSSMEAPAIEGAAPVNTSQGLDHTSHDSLSGSGADSSVTSQSGPEGSTGTNSSSEPTPHSESTGGEVEHGTSEPTSEVMLAMSFEDEPYNDPLARVQLSSATGSRTGHSTGARSAAVDAFSASAGAFAGGSSSNSGTDSLADVKNTPVGSLPAQEDDSNGSSPAPFVSQPQPEGILEPVLTDAPELVSESRPTPPAEHFDETWPKHHASEPVQVPEPSSLVLLGLGLIGLAMASRKRA